MFRELKSEELQEVDGGGIIMGTVAMLIGTASASLAVVSAISIPATGLAGAGVASGSAAVSYYAFSEAMDELNEGTIF